MNVVREGLRTGILIILTLAALTGVLAAAWRASRITALEALSDLPGNHPVMTGWRWLM